MRRYPRKFTPLESEALEDLLKDVLAKLETYRQSSQDTSVSEEETNLFYWLEKVFPNDKD
jgi:hypothetical protein